MNGKNIGSLIKKLRIAKGYSQETLAKKLGISHAAISKWERGLTENLKMANLVGLKQIFNINIDDLIQGIEHHGEETDEIPDGNPSKAKINQPSSGLSRRQQALLGLFEGLTDSQKDALIRDLEEKKQQNDELLIELLKRKAE
ncbi:helix-turn-helix domain-containing protein [Nitrosomonas sp.]|uniref:helix-turn-helix domain-containing protein n=1 Tax=Nitrosomonas sp. TaxID=42353 RepID=UPI0037CC818C